jgi:DNA-binding beta-propeller fold protein YncE
MLSPARRRGRRRLRLLVLLLIVAGGAGAGLLLTGSDRDASADDRPAVQAAANEVSVTSPARFVERQTGTLQSPVQDAAAVSLGGNRAMLLGGLTAADTSRADIRILTGSGDRAAGALPTGLHDTAAVRIGSAVYVFGGGTSANTQSDAIVRVPASGGNGALVGHLPAPSSDQSASAIGGTAYIVGGYTGTRWLDTIVAWRPGSQAHVVARLQAALRYAAVATAGGHLVIAGGSLENGTASSAVLEFTPGQSRVQRIGRLPAPTTHAASAAIGSLAYIIGGRGAVLGSATSRIVSIDVRTGSIKSSGTLASPRSDLAAVATGNTILLVGGRGPAGTSAHLSELVVGVPTRSSQTARTSTRPVGAKGVYTFDGAGMLRGAARSARSLVYVPNSQSATVEEIDPRTFKIVRHFAVGLLPQHVVPSYGLTTLYVTNDLGNSLTPIDPRTGKPGRTVPVDDPYNMYFTPNGRYAIVVAERLHRLDFRNANTFALHHSLAMPCSGVDHMDFSADGRYLIASCEFSGQLIKVDVKRERVLGVLSLPDGAGGMPQDVRISPDGRIFYVADLAAGGVWKVDGRRFKVMGLIRTGAGAHGLYPSRNGKDLYVSNRSAGTVSVVSFATRKVVETWRIPGGGSPDMGGVSADGKVLWLSGRYNSEVYAISTTTGQLLARIRVGSGPHGLCVWPQPGRYSLGHTDNMR